MIPPESSSGIHPRVLQFLRIYFRCSSRSSSRDYPGIPSRNPSVISGILQEEFLSSGISLITIFAISPGVPSRGPTIIPFEITPIRLFSKIITGVLSGTLHEFRPHFFRQSSKTSLWESKMSSRFFFLSGIHALITSRTLPETPYEFLKYYWKLYLEFSQMLLIKVLQLFIKLFITEFFKEVHLELLWEFCMKSFHAFLMQFLLEFFEVFRL